MSKVKAAYEKSVDFILALLFQFWFWLGCKLDVTIEVPVLKGDAGVNPEIHEAVKAERDALLAENRQLKWALDGHHGASPTGPNRPNAKKLTKREVREIRDYHRSGVPQATIAGMYDVNPATISRIVRGHYHKTAA